MLGFLFLCFYCVFVDILYIICYNLINNKTYVSIMTGGNYMGKVINDNSTKYNNNTQIGRIDGRGCFFEVLSNMFDRNKVIIKFVTYDETTFKQTNDIAIFLDIEEFLVICEDMNFGTIQRKADVLKKEQKYDSIYESLGGKVHKALVNGVLQKTGKVDSRIFKISAATKSNSADLMFTAIAASGVEQPTGLITPDFSKPYERIMVPVQSKKVRGLFLKTKLRIEAFYAQQAINGLYDLNVKGDNTNLNSDDRNTSSYNNTCTGENKSSSNNPVSDQSAKQSAGATQHSSRTQAPQPIRRTAEERSKGTYNSRWNENVIFINDKYPEKVS